MKWKRSKKAAQEAKQSSKSPPDTAGSGTEAAKMSDAEYDSDSSRNDNDGPTNKCNKSNSSAESISPGTAPSSHLFKSSSGLKSSSSSPEHADLSQKTWNSAPGNGLIGMGVMPVNHATILQQTHHHRHPSMVGESFYRHFVS